MNIFAFAIIPVMFSVHTIVSWDFAVATRPAGHPPSLVHTSSLAPCTPAWALVVVLAVIRAR
jgi:hypothetical protein